MKLRNLLLSLFFCISALSTFAQKQYGFEWIKPYQSYYKFKIINDGVYSIDSAFLAQSGINIGAINPMRIQIFRNGIEIPLYINGEHDSVLNTKDRIEFFAQHNDGRLDSLLYLQPQYQPHQWRSMITDTAIYFLTILPDTTQQIGKRFISANDTAFSSYTPEPYFINEVKIFPSDYYVTGPDIGNFDHKYNSSEYLDGEGWASSLIGMGSSASFSLNTPFKSTAGGAPNPVVEIKIIPDNNASPDTAGKNHHVLLSVSPDNFTFSTISNGDIKFSNYTVQHIISNISKSQIGNTQTTFKFDVINDLGLASDYNSLSYIKLNYACQYNLGNQTSRLFNIANSQINSFSLVNFQNYGNGISDSIPLFYDLTLNKRIKGFYNSGNAMALITNDGQPHQIMLVDSKQINSISSLTPVQFHTIDPTSGYEFLLVTHPALFNAASQYANYRKTRYKTLMVYSQELYDYYTFGNPHPIAIRRLADHLLTVATSKPKFLLLAGRGYETDLIRDQTFNPSLAYNNNYVPSIGVPSSDIMFTNGLIGSGFEADIPTGRIPAETTLDLQNYLDKLKYYEGADSIQEWRKNVLHITGGQLQSEQDLFKSYLNADRSIIQGKSFGAKVITYNKTNSNATTPQYKDQLIQVQNAGFSLLTFLGHASGTTLDVEIGSISDLTNVNKYPLFYINGCDAGNANGQGAGNAAKIYGKDYVCAQSKGVIGWIASTNLSIDGNLGAQMSTFYNQFCNTNYGKPIGFLMQQTSKQFAGQDIITKMHNIQWLLQGDPATVIFSPALPDYKIASTDLFITPQNTNALSDSFAVAVIITNLARATNDSIEISLTRTLSNGTTKSYPTLLYKPIYFKDTVYLWIKSKDQTTFGNNLFDVTVNKQKKFIESNFGNNEASINFYMPGSGLTNITPMKYSIVNSDTVNLIAQNNDYFAQNIQYIFEIDTSANFNSIQYKRSPIITAGPLATWQLVLPHTDTLVYFWRANFNNAPPGVMPNTSSFTYIRNGETGWAQSKFDQYKNVTAYQNLILDSNQIQFVDNAQKVTSSARRWNHAYMGNFYSNYPLDPSTGGAAPLGCELSNGIVVDIFNGKTLQSMENPRYPWTCQYVINNTNLGVYYYTFNTTIQSGRDEFRKFIDSLDDGTYIAIWAKYDADVRDWDALTKSYLGKIGSQKVGAIKSYFTTFALIGRKGWQPGQASEDTLYNDKFSTQDTRDSDIVSVSLTMTGKWYTGYLNSEKIGPTKHWGKIFYNFNSFENGSHDKNYVNLFGVKNDGTDTLLLSNIATGTDISSVNTTVIPYLKLSVTFTDTVTRTPNQFGRWIVTYQSVAEGTINPLIAYDFYKDKISQGDSLKFKIGFQNLTKNLFDSLPVELKITDANRIVQYDKIFMYPPLGENASTIINQSISTKNLTGDNSLQLSVNGNMRTPEFTLTNNVWTKNFSVLIDKTNPIMDVTFDGYRIMNGDYVSPTPVIQISSKDDNPYLIQNDTSTFALFLKRPNSTSPERVNLNTNNIHFTPGNSKNNNAILSYSPDKLTDGMYTLQVIAKDASGNLSGSNMYAIDFNVVSASTITNFFPYPNPCTTSMRFVFTLTGSKAPEDLLIRIMTISGKIVKEVTKQEFGNIHIGNNISEWAWDGNDMYGDRLANGVYLYQVLTRIDGNAISKLDTKADKYFIQNTGKIYLLH
jgi:hypothetical protein